MTSDDSEGPLTDDGCRLKPSASASLASSASTCGQSEVCHLCYAVNDPSKTFPAFSWSSGAADDS